MATLSLFVLGLLQLHVLSSDQTAYIYSLPVGLPMFARAFTHMVSHANIQHLVGNFTFGLPYMLYLEYKLKSFKKFIRLFFCFGIAALLGQCLAVYCSIFKSSGMIGSSGAIFGLVALALLSFNGNRLYKYIFRTTLLFFIVKEGMAAYEGLLFPSGIGNAAHLAGMLAACLVYRFCSLYPKKVLVAVTSRRHRR